MEEQRIIMVENDYYELDEFLIKSRAGCILLVCSDSVHCLRISKYFESLEERLGIRVVWFSDFDPNPVYESVVSGVEVFCKEKCDFIVAVGGGSAIDVAKCIKLYSQMDHSRNYLKQKIVPNRIKLLATPTTAGTGSEATRYSVIYYRGEKQSVTDDSCIPCAVVFDRSVLRTLPEYQKAATLMDAFCHALESFWSVNSTPESKGYSASALKIILENIEPYLECEEQSGGNMLEAAHIAGKAINITQTTAGHAMCYKLTSLYGIAHGHAAALCTYRVWEYMIQHTENCIDSRGREYLEEVFREIAVAMGCGTVQEALELFKSILTKLQLSAPAFCEHDLRELVLSVNPIRLANNPVELDTDTIEQLYRKMLCADKKKEIQK